MGLESPESFANYREPIVLPSMHYIAPDQVYRTKLWNHLMLNSLDAHEQMKKWHCEINMGMVYTTIEDYKSFVKLQHRYMITHKTEIIQNEFVGAVLTRWYRNFIHYEVYVGNGFTVGFCDESFSTHMLVHLRPVSEHDLKRMFPVIFQLITQQEAVDMIEQTIQLLDVSHYDFIFNNCEHIARLIILNSARSVQVVTGVVFTVIGVIAVVVLILVSVMIRILIKKKRSWSETRL